MWDKSSPPPLPPLKDVEQHINRVGATLIEPRLYDLFPLSPATRSYDGGRHLVTNPFFSWPCIYARCVSIFFSQGVGTTARKVLSQGSTKKAYFTP